MILCLPGSQSIPAALLKIRLLELEVTRAPQVAARCLIHVPIVCRGIAGAFGNARKSEKIAGT